MYAPYERVVVSKATLDRPVPGELTSRAAHCCRARNSATSPTEANKVSIRSAAAASLSEAQARFAVIGLHVVDTNPDSLLAPGVGGLGWAPVTTIEVVLRSRLGGRLGHATDDELQAVDAALKAVLNLGDE